MNRNIRSNQDGLVAFVVSIMVLIIVVVTTVGMVILANRESRQALDRQLSTQAYFAAESGINDAISTIQAEIAIGNAIPAYNDCDDGTNLVGSITNNTTAKNTLTLNSVLGGSNVLDTSAESKYTCVLVSENPVSLEYLKLQTDNAAVGDITFSAADEARQVVIGWEDSQGGNSFRKPLVGFPDGCGVFPSASNWKAAPLLKVDITNLKGSNFTRTDLLDDTASYYLDPCKGASSGGPVVKETFKPGINSDGNGKILSGTCDPGATHMYANKAPLRCSVIIEMPGVTTTSNFLFRIKPVYGTARVTIIALDSSDKPLKMIGGQIVIDVTGKAGDVVKRTQVRIANSTTNPVVPYLYAIESSLGVCKRFVVVDTGNSFNGSHINPVPEVCDITSD